MKVGVIQSCFIPWRGYFDFIRSVDLFVFYDDVQYSKNGWRNRNRIKTPSGTRWITVPVRHRSLTQLICETQIDNKIDWRQNHFHLWKENYPHAPYLRDVLTLLGDMEQGQDALTLSQLNVTLTRSICAYLEISTPFAMSADFNVTGTKTERLLNLLRKVGATAYLSGPSADDYLDKEAFRGAGIALEYKSYDYAPYPQQWGDFDGAVSVLDLIANLGPEAKRYIRSNTPDKVIIPPGSSN